MKKAVWLSYAPNPRTAIISRSSFCSFIGTLTYLYIEAESFFEHFYRKMTPLCADVPEIQNDLQHYNSDESLAEIAGTEDTPAIVKIQFINESTG